MKDWSLGASLKALFIGRARSLSDRRLYHNLSLVAVLAWVGLGADGLSSSCYGPEEVYHALGAHPVLGLFVALAAVFTILVLCASYRQIIARFPSGGGGYLVASKLLGPGAGVTSGAALLVDYVLTIAISVASAADSLFSVLPPAWAEWKLVAALGGIALLTLLNLRGVKESVLLWTPVFFLFIATHAVALAIALIAPPQSWAGVVGSASHQLQDAHQSLGWLGMLVLVMKAYSLGAGTFTGIEAVSNGLPILREPRVDTARRTMNYMAVSLAVTVFALLAAYHVYGVHPEPGKTLNAVLFERVTAGWPDTLGLWFTRITMASATALLFIAAQAGFLDGPRVAATMALDRWLPTRFASLSDRFVTQNGILLMGGAALLVAFATQGAVKVLIVLYSINVFVTFSLSQLGMAADGWRRRSEPAGLAQLRVNGFGFVLSASVLASLCVFKFHDGGWITMVVTLAVVLVAFWVRRHYKSVANDLKSLDVLVAEMRPAPLAPPPPVIGNRTAILFVNGYNSLGLHTFLGVTRLFPATFKRFVFIEVGAVDAGTFKGADELQRLQVATDSDVQKYAELARAQGYEVEGMTAVSQDIVGTLANLGRKTLDRFPDAIVFCGQLVFRQETRLTRWLHNYAVFALQRNFCREGVPFVIVPAKV